MENCNRIFFPFKLYIAKLPSTGNKQRKKYAKINKNNASLEIRIEAAK